jgi:hypothetical protein
MEKTVIRLGYGMNADSTTGGHQQWWFGGKVIF